MLRGPVVVVGLLGLLPLGFGQEKRWELDLETGGTTTRYNTAAVPRDTGTMLDLRRLIGTQSRAFGRASVLYHDSNGGTWKLLYAPFAQSGTGTLGAPANFGNRAFAAGQVNARYQFNSYRLTYRKETKGGWIIGGTLKVRDAEIRLDQGATSASESNIGLVPLLNVYRRESFQNGWGYEFEFDGLAGGPGRAFDISARVTRAIGNGTTAFLGYRLLEGGADTDRVKNFAWVNYFTVGVTVSF